MTLTWLCDSELACIACSLPFIDRVIFVHSLGRQLAAIKHHVGLWRDICISFDRSTYGSDVERRVSDLNELVSSPLISNRSMWRALRHFVPCLQIIHKLAIHADHQQALLSAVDMTTRQTFELTFMININTIAVSGRAIGEYFMGV